VAHAAKRQGGERYGAHGVGGRSRPTQQVGLGGVGVGQADASGTRPQGPRHGGPTGQPRPAQSRVGRDVDGFPGGLDGCPVHAWPAGPREPQHRWEPPRTITARIPNRAARLRALGNAVVPQQAFPIFAAIVAAWRETEACRTLALAQVGVKPDCTARPLREYAICSECIRQARKGGRAPWPRVQ
jgi:hypothetical protein